MGSEGYLINQFLTRRTNHRTDQWGGPLANRVRFPEEIVSRIRQACGPDFAIMYRLSMLDLVEEGNGWGEVVEQAQIIEAAGADIINTGIGWHEARIPTIAAMVPRAGFAWVTKKLMGQVGLPLVTTNRINMPEVAEQVLADGCADLVSMARPWLADGDIIAKAVEGREDRAAVRLTMEALDGSVRVHTLKLDLRFWPTQVFELSEGEWTGTTLSDSAVDAAE